MLRHQFCAYYRPRQPPRFCSSTRRAASAKVGTRWTRRLSASVLDTVTYCKTMTCRGHSNCVPSSCPSFWTGLQSAVAAGDRQARIGIRRRAPTVLLGRRRFEWGCLDGGSVQGRTLAFGHNQPEAGASGVSPLGRSASGGGAQRLDSPLVEAIHARSPEPSDEHRPRTAGQRFDAGYSDNGGVTGCGGSRLISSLPGLK